MNIYSIYFSPTGGTRKVADIIADAIGPHTDIDLSFPETERRASDYSFGRDDLCIISVPSFSGRVPAMALSRMSSFVGNSAKAVLVAVYGNREFEDTLVELKDFTESKGFETFAAVAAVAEHSIAREIATGRPDEADTSELKAFADRIKEKLAAEGGNEPCGDKAACGGNEPCGIGDTELVSLAELPGNRPYKQVNAKGGVKPFADDSCVKCQKCATSCPAGAIPMEAPEQTDNERCISCMRCISVCPVGARHIPEAAAERISGMLAKSAGTRKEIKIYI